ncbi:MAG: ABC transporter ATP-binding protein [Christensenellaceae bacterium]|jgi:ATP-binding cassette subfamily B multidrug efflux pump
MIKLLARYLKPFGILLLVTVGLLFVQAFCDLNLPNYMSSIVNVGLQQGGITESAPVAVSMDGYAVMTAFMTDEDAEFVSAHYEKIPAGDAAYSKTYELNKTEDIYVRKEADAQALQTLNSLFGEAGWTMINIVRQIMPDSGNTNAATDMENIDASRLQELLPVLDTLPEDTVDSARARAAQVPESMRDQTGTAFVKMFYRELGVNTDDIQNGYIVDTGLSMLLLSLLAVAAAVAIGFFSSRIAAGVARNLRRDVFNKVESFSGTEFDHFSTASLITRTTNDITQIQTIIAMGVRMICYAPIMGVGGIIMALNKSVSMAWVIALAVIALLALLVGVFLVAMPKFKLMQKLIDKLNLVSRENLSGIMVIRAFGTQEFEEDRFDQANQTLTKNNLFVGRVMVFMLPMMMLIMNCVSLLIVWVGAGQIESSTMQIGDMMAYIQYAMMIIMSFLMIAVMFIMVPRASVSAQRILEVLDIPLTVVDPPNPRPMGTEERGKVEFKNVSFKYGDAEDCVLEDISFTANPGETTAFIGSTGSGKSTLINLIPRFYDVTEGQILVSGIDVRAVSQHDLHEQIGYVPQKGVLFSGTIASNLRYGKEDATDEEIKLAADIAQATEFIEQSEKGFGREISESGTNVSGGQKQRLSIARALVKNAPIYIFDDSFSALDFKTDVTLRRALRPYTKNSTVFIVAQRISTIMKAEQIIVLDKGRIVGKGTHSELMDCCPEYIEIAQSQLGGDAV